MKITITQAAYTSLLVISDQDRTRVIDLNLYGVSNKTTSWLLHNCFVFFNEHVIPLHSVGVQYEIYNRTIACLDRAKQDGEIGELQEDLSFLCAHMLDLVEVDKISMLVHTSGLVKVPVNVCDTFQHGVQAGSLDQTYLTADYKNMVAMSCVTKFMIPIWLEQFRRIESSVTRSYTEPYGYRILSRSKVMTMPAMKKLRTFIDHYVQANDTSDSRLRTAVSGVGTYQIPENAIARAVVAICPYINPMSTSLDAGTMPDEGELDKPSGSTVMTKLFYAVQQTTKFTPRRSTGLVSAKFDRSWVNNDQDSSSTLEEFRAAGGITEEDKEFANAYASNAHRMLEHAVAGKINLTKDHHDLLDVFLHHAYYRDGGRPLLLQKCQTSVAIWLFGTTNWREVPVLPVRYRDYLRMEAMYNMLAVAQTFMWIMGYKRLAGLISASVLPNNYISGGGGRDRVKDPAKLKYIDTAFTAAIYTKGRRRNSVESTPQENRALQAIEFLISPPSDEKKIGFASVTWCLRLPPAMIKEITGNENVVAYPCPREISSDLIDYTACVF